jgi:hypothetical protein
MKAFGIKPEQHIGCLKTPITLLDKYRSEEGVKIGVKADFSFLPSLLTYLLTYLPTYLLTPCNTVLLKKLTGLQLVKKFLAFY